MGRAGGSGRAPPAGRRRRTAVRPRVCGLPLSCQDRGRGWTARHARRGQRHPGVTVAVARRHVSRIIGAVGVGPA